MELFNIYLESNDCLNESKCACLVTIFDFQIFKIFRRDFNSQNNKELISLMTLAGV